MKVTLNAIRLMSELRLAINSTPLEDIDLYEDFDAISDNDKIEVDPEIVREFGMTGLNNIDFITSGYYRRTK